MATPKSDIAPTDCVTVMGRRGCGKSYLARNLQALWPRRVIIDCINEYGPKDGTIVHSFDKFAEQLIEYKKNKSKKFVLIFQFDPENILSADEFDEILRISFYFGNIQIVIEEIQEFSTPNKIPHWLRKCLMVGRHNNLSLLFTSQRPGQVHKSIISQSSHVFCGQINEGNDLNYLSNIFREQTEKLVNIPDRQFLYFSKKGIQQIRNDFRP